MKTPDLTQLVEANKIEQLTQVLRQVPSAVNLHGKYSVTPLIRAAEMGNEIAVELLLNHGADPNQKVRGETPLGISLKHGSIGLVERLLHAGAKASVPSFGINGPPLVYAARHGSSLLVKCLIEAKADSNAYCAAFGYSSDGSLGIGRTALMEAAERGHAEVVRLLLEAGADPWIKGVENKTAYDLVAKRKGREAVAALLSEWMQKHPQKPASPPAPTVLDFSTPFASWDDALRRLKQATSGKGIPHPQAKAVTRFQLSLDVAILMAGKAAGGKPLEIYRHALATMQTLSAKLDATWFLQFEPARGAFLCVLPKGGKWKVLGAFKTACVNYGVTHAALLKFLKSLDTEQPFDLIECDFSSVGGRYRGTLVRPEKVAQRLFEFCPFVAEDDGGSVKRFAKALARAGYFRIWWD